MGELRAVYSQLRNHKERGDSYHGTLLRLVKKQLEARVVTALTEAINEDQVIVVNEIWDRHDVELLWSRNVEGRPYSDENPLVVLRIAGIHMLIDGHNRRTKWLQEKRVDYPVTVLEVLS